MKIWLLRQTKNTQYDTYGGAVVVAPSELAARYTHPDPAVRWVCSKWKGDPEGWADPVGSWVHPSDVEVTEIGEASGPARVVLADFRAG